MKRKTIINLPIEYSRIAADLGLSRQRVWAWFQPGRQVPAKWVRPVEKLTGIPRHLIRPDIYEAPNV